MVGLGLIICCCKFFLKGMIEMLFYVGVVVVIECVMMDLINDGVIVGGIVVVSLVVIFVLVFIIIFFC